jgi:hypothetical protein
MLKTIITTLLFLAASSANAQAPLIEMPPARPPMVRPVVNPPSFPTPGATPAGAGIEVPTREGDVQVVPRSPNKRILPATKEAGFWAADGAPQASAASSPAPFFDVSLPYPAPEAGLGARLLMDRCIDGVTAAAEQVGKRADIAKLPEPARKCLAASYLFACGHEGSLKLGNVPPTEPLAMEEIMAAINLQSYGERMKEAFCPKAGVVPEQKSVFEEVLDRWMSNELDRKTSRSTH